MFQKLLAEYVQWLENSTAQESQQFFKGFDEKWSGFINHHDQVHSDTNALLRNHDKISVEIAKSFSTSAAARLFDQEISEVVSYFPYSCWYIFERFPGYIFQLLKKCFDMKVFCRMYIYTSVLDHV